MAPATSSAVTSRPMGWRASSAARSATGSGAAASSLPTQGVLAVPGVTQLTRMPSATWSAAIASVSDSTAPLVAEYSARPGRPAVAAIEQVLTIAACRDRRRYGKAARATRTMPNTLTSNTRRHSSSSLSSTVPCAPTPALLTSTSRPPRWSVARATPAHTAAASVTSAITPYSGTGGLRRSRQATAASRVASSRAVASPMPDAPPVTRALIPANSAPSGGMPRSVAIRTPRTPRRAVGEGVSGARLGLQLRRQAGPFGNLVAAVHDADRVDEVLVQVVDVLDGTAGQLAADRDVVEHRQVLDHLAQADAARVRAHGHAERGGQQQDRHVLRDAGDPAGV